MAADKPSKLEQTSVWAANSTIGISVVSFVVDRLRAAGANLHTDVPVLDAFVDHAGNVGVSGLLGIAGAKIVSKVDTVRALSTTQRIVGAGVLGLALGAGFNAIPDSQWGMDHIGKYVYQCQKPDPADNGPYCTVDPADLAWGTTTSVLFGMALVPWYKREHSDLPPPSSLGGGFLPEH